MVWEETSVLNCWSRYSLSNYILPQTFEDAIEEQYFYISFVSGDVKKLSVLLKALLLCGEYRSRTGDLLHAMQTL